MSNVSGGPPAPLPKKKTKQNNQILGFLMVSIKNHQTSGCPAKKSSVFPKEDHQTSGSSPLKRKCKNIGFPQKPLEQVVFKMCRPFCLSPNSLKHHTNFQTYHCAPPKKPSNVSIPQRKYQQTTVSHGFQVVRIGFRSSAAWQAFRKQSASSPALLRSILSRGPRLVWPSRAFWESRRGFCNHPQFPRRGNDKAKEKEQK